MDNYIINETNASNGYQLADNEAVSERMIIQLSHSDKTAHNARENEMGIPIRS